MKWIYGFVLFFVLLSCKGVKYVPVESVQYDSVYLNKIVKDSIYVKDSVLVIKGDTVVEYRYKYIYQYKDRTDTLYVTRTDSIRVPYPVEKELTRWQSLKVELGGWAFGMVIAFALIIVGWMVYRCRRK